MRGVLAAAVAVLAVAAGIYAWLAHDLNQARARLAGRSVTMSTPSGTLEYAVAGTGEPALIVHGAAGGFDQGLDIAAPLAGKGFRLIAPSRFGYLGTPVPADPGSARQADAYVALLDRLDVSRAFVVAISAGAWSAAELAIRHPDRCRALVLISPAGYLPPGTANYGGALLRAMLRSDLVGWAAIKATPLLPGAMAGMMLGTDPAVLRAADAAERTRVLALVDHMLPLSARSAGMQLDIESASSHTPQALDKISCPVLAISAEDDTFGTAARAKAIAKAVTDGRAVIYPAGGHVLVGQLADALDEVAAFLGEH